MTVPRRAHRPEHVRLDLIVGLLDHPVLVVGQCDMWHRRGSSEVPRAYVIGTRGQLQNPRIGTKSCYIIGQSPVVKFCPDNGGRSESSCEDRSSTESRRLEEWRPCPRDRHSDGGESLIA